MELLPTSHISICVFQHQVQHADYRGTCTFLQFKRIYLFYFLVPLSMSSYVKSIIVLYKTCVLVGFRGSDTPPHHDVSGAHRRHVSRLPPKEQHNDHHQRQKAVQLWWLRYGGLLFYPCGVRKQ